MNISEEPLIAPVFSLPTLADRAVSFGECGGRLALLNVQATWCPGALGGVRAPAVCREGGHHPPSSPNRRVQS